MDKATVVEEVARSMRKSLAMNACSQVIDLFDALQSFDADAVEGYDSFVLAIAERGKTLCEVIYGAMYDDDEALTEESMLSMVRQVRPGGEIDSVIAEWSKPSEAKAPKPSQRKSAGGKA